MSGEALTTPTSAIGDLTGKLVEIDVERVLAMPGKGQQKIGSVEPRDARRHLLGNHSPAISVHRRGQPQFATKMRWIFPHRGKNFVGHRQGHGRHGPLLKP